MSYVDPNFDTYSLDACVRYGILDCDPCLYLKGTPSPYLTNFYPPAAVPVKPMKPDTFEQVPPKKDIMPGIPAWKKVAFTLLVLALGTTFVVKKPDIAKKIIPQKVRKFFVDHTPKCVKKFFSDAATKVKSWFKK